MITAALFRDVLTRLGEQGAQDVAWSEGIKPPEDPDDMALETIFVVCNSGMKHTVARGIYTACCQRLVDGERVQGFILGRSGKAAAIDRIWETRVENFRLWRALGTNEAKLTFLEGLPFIGKITKWHLAKNFGMDVAKPDVHLMRLARLENTTPQLLCERLAREVGLRIATVDTILWRACAVRVLDPHTGTLRP